MPGMKSEKTFFNPLNPWWWKIPMADVVVPCATENNL
jgi:hypothetical protein